MFNLLCICLAKLQQGTWLMMMTLGNWQTDIRRDGLPDWLTDEVGDVTHAFLWPHKSRIAVLGFSLASHTLVPTAPRRSLCVHCARMHVCVYKCVCVCVGECTYMCMNWITKCGIAFEVSSIIEKYRTIPTTEHEFISSLIVLSLIITLQIILTQRNY